MCSELYYPLLSAHGPEVLPEGWALLTDFNISSEKTDGSQACTHVDPHHSNTHHTMYTHTHDVHTHTQTTQMLICHTMYTHTYRTPFKHPSIDVTPG